MNAPTKLRAAVKLLDLALEEMKEWPPTDDNVEAIMATLAARNNTLYAQKRVESGAGKEQVQ